MKQSQKELKLGYNYAPDLGFQHQNANFFYTNIRSPPLAIFSTWFSPHYDKTMII